MRMSDDAAERFLNHPEDFVLFRGERPDNQGGLHFTNEKEWALNFGKNILMGCLPAKSKIRILTEADMDAVIVHGIYGEQGLWDSLFEQGYDAILGHEPMRPRFLDVVVHPKHLGRFKML